MDLPDDVVKFRNDGDEHSLVLGHSEQGMHYKSVQVYKLHYRFCLNT
jgi:hypothetical protein